MKIGTTSDSLIITLDGVEMFLALRRRLVIPRGHIVNIEWKEQFYGLKPLWRLAGTGAPGVLFAGYFRSRGRRYFLYVRKPRGWASMTARNVLVIETQNFRFDNVIITVSPSQADEVLAWWRS